MDKKQQILTALREELSRWENMLSDLSEEQIVNRQLPSDLSIKDVIGHLRAWQQVSIARLEAAQHNHEPAYPDWLAGLDPESEEHIEQFNARIHEIYRQQPWSQVHQEWQDGFLRLLELSEAIPEKDLFDTEKYPWLKGYALVDVLQGTHEHHHIDHLEPILAWFHQQKP